MEATARSNNTNTRVHQVELDSGITADAEWTAAADRDTCRALRPTAGHAVQVGGVFRAG